RHRSRPIYPGLDLHEAVALIVLSTVGIARPEDNEKGLSILLEFREHDLGQSLGKEFLLLDIGNFRSWLVRIARLAVVATGRRDNRELGRRQPVADPTRQRNTRL